MFLRDFLELVHVITHDIRRNCETHSLSRNALGRERHFCRADADQTAREIDHRSTAITWINRGVRLYQALVLCLVHSNVALDRAKNSAADRATISDRISYYDYSLAQQVRRNIIKIDKRECSPGVDLDECQIGLVIAGNVVSAVGFAVVCCYMNFQVGGALNHVLVGNDVAFRIDNETRTKTLQRLANFTWPGAIIAEELSVKILKRIAHRAPHYALGVNINHCRQDFRYSQNGGLRSRISLAKTSFCLGQNQ